jgi:glycosyltransferase involved in cell wall biosynthesis
VAISVIVPVYNVAAELPRCLDSLVAQTLDGIEIIVVNDASTDDSLRIIRDYEGRYPDSIRVIDSPENRKLGGARNLGLDAAGGTWVGFVDGDDWVAPDMYESLLHTAAASQCDVVDSDYEVVDGDVRTLVISNTEAQLGDLTTDRKRELIVRPGRLWTKLFRISLFRDNGIHFPDRLFFEDNPTMPLLMSYASRLGKVSRPLYHYFARPTSITRRTGLHHFDRLATSRMLLDEFRRRGLYDTYRDEVDFRFAELYYANTVLTCLLRFDRPEVAHLEEVRSFMRATMPAYRSNPYFNRLSWKTKVVTKLNDVNPHLLAAAYRAYRALPGVRIPS